jgi:Flp pilus assembly protein CpaB
LIIVPLGTVGALWALGLVDLRFGKATAASHEGMVAVPISGQSIPMYTRVVRDHLFDPKTQSLQILYLRPEQISPNMIIRIEDILGRVVNHDKPAGYAFTEADFLPKGTHPGIAAGIPPGKRAITLEAEKIKGVASFKAGDHLDIVGTIALDDKKGGTANGVVTVSTGQARMMKHAAVLVLVQDGVVVSPVTLRQVPTTTSSLTGGQMTRARAVQEVVIALDPKEIAKLTEALALNEEVMAVGRSGRPDDPGASSITPERPPPRVTVVETLVGSKRRLFSFPEDGSAPTVSDPSEPPHKPEEKPAPPEPAAGSPRQP